MNKPPQFILPMKTFSHSHIVDALMNAMLADDLVVIARHSGERQRALETWKELFPKRGRTMNKEQTKMTWVEDKNEEFTSSK